MKLYLQTYGCQMNELDSARIARLMKTVDYERTDRPDEADLIVLNTCSVRDKAEQKVYSALGRWRELKSARKELVLAVGGCVAQQEGETLLNRVPYLDVVFGTHNIHKLPQLVLDARSSARRSAALTLYKDPFYLEDPAGRPEVDGIKAFVTVMQGCNKVCSFCIVPRVRGREVSRPSEQIVDEIRTLVTRGVKEVTLLGQNVNSYGNTSQNELSFAKLLEKINGIEGLKRIRFTTSHPQDLSAELISAFANLDKLCEHLHLPLQSGADSTLRRMRRGYSLEQYLNRIRELRLARPDIALTTDMIVGFPGETEGEFEGTLEIVKKIEYDDMFAFMYSPRPQTVSAKIYADDVRPEVKKERLKKLQMLQNDISLRKNQAFIGQEQQVLVEGPAKLSDHQVMGRTRTNKIVNFSRNRLTGRGRLVQVMVTGASSNSLVGELIRGAA